MRWSNNISYIIGLIASDGNLSKDGRHIIFTSKDYELAKTFHHILDLKTKISLKTRSSEKEKKYYNIQIGNKKLYNFLLKIGLTPKKSKTLKQLKIPKKYFFHFLRGCIDGDGYFYSYKDKRWKNSFVFYLCLSSASIDFTQWIRTELKIHLKINGHITQNKGKTIYYLKYGKKESIKIIYELYKNPNSPKLLRKYLKIKNALSIINKTLP